MKRFGFLFVSLFSAGECRRTDFWRNSAFGQVEVHALRFLQISFIPPGLEMQARQVAFLVSRLSQTTLSTIGSKQKPVDIVFHNLTTISNGYVQLAPFRSEFQLTPSQNSFDLGSLPWNQTLAIHEYRHVQQYNNFCVGLSKVFYILFGQDGLAFANNLSVPNWFLEGDAVFQETLVSQQGRGRLAFFPYRI